MKFFKIIFFPLMIMLYIFHAIILFIRNLLYDYNIYTTHYLQNISIVSIGSLNMGGTGKTPLVEYIINILPNSKIALLSRGYKRKSTGFLFAKKQHSAFELGDEVNQIHKKNLELTVAVDKNRVRGVKKILEKHNKKIIILDDAHQHRRLGRDLNILVTEYDKLYSKDFLFPLGELIECRSGAKRAQIIVITKCPKNITIVEKKIIKKNLSLNEGQSIFFSHIKEYKFIYNNNFTDINKNENYFLVTGIANPKPLLKKLTTMKINYSHFPYTDHHFFTKSDINDLVEKAKEQNVKHLIMTEKDFYRLSEENFNIIHLHFKLFYTQIEFDFIKEEKVMFNKQILKFI